MESPPRQFIKSIPITLGERECILHNKTFYEKVDKKTLDALINHEGLQDSWNTENYSQKVASQLYTNEKQQLTSYKNNYKIKKAAVSVRYMKAHRQRLGRVFPIKSLGLTTMSRKTRNTLIKDNMIDVDLVNCQPQILYCVCKSNNIECNFIEQYNNNREPILAEMMSTYNLKRSACKKLFIRLAFGGTFYGFLKDNNLDDTLQPTEFITNFTNQLTTIGNIFKTNNELLYEKIKKTKKDNVMGSFMSKILQEYETRILECMYLYLLNNTNIVKDDYFVYEYDGMKLIKDRVEKYGVDTLINDLQNIVLNELGFDMKLEIKPIDEYYELTIDEEGCEAGDDDDEPFVIDIEIDAIGCGFCDVKAAKYIYKKFCFKEGEIDFTKDNQLFVSSGIKNKCQLWYKFKNNKWNIEKDAGFIHTIISTKFYEIINRYRLQMLNKVDTAQEPYKTKYDSLEGLCGRTQQHGWLSTIVSNLYVLCKIDDFEAKLDLNQYLVCCNNGVIDLQNKLFRQGKPSDMCSLSTGIDYVDYNVEESDEVIVDEIDNFFSQLFPNQSKRQYMLNHLGSVFYGNTSNQALNYYIGAGSNGKSQLVDLMGHVMGQYKGSVPLSLITAKRALVGGTSSEVIALRGVRYAVIQEPSKNDTINEGIMKELTGGDPITARGLYKEAVTFKPMFDLVVCANIFLNINSNDHGTWRRMKVVEFGSKFVDENVCEDDYVFKKDKNLSLKFEKWKGYVLHMLIQIAFQNNGKVGDHDAVQDATERYRLSQDKVGQFIRDKIIKTDDKTIRVSKSTLSRAFKEWSEEKFKYSMKGKDLFDRLDETYISNSMVYGGFELLYEPKTNDVDAFNIDQQFIESFDLKYELTNDFKNDYIARSDLQEWAKSIKLKICTTREISRVLLEHKNIDLSDKKYCKDKIINRKGVRCVFGIKLK